MLYHQDQLVFAKVKGFSPWPATIIQSMSLSSYRVFFFGTHQESTVNEKNIWPYEEKKVEFCGRYGSRKAYKKAIDEVEQVEQMGGRNPEEENVLEEPAQVYKKARTAQKKAKSNLAQTKKPAKTKSKFRTSRKLFGNKVKVSGGRRNVQVPGAGVQVPDAGVQIPDAGVQVPGDGIQVPGAGVQVPGGGVHAMGSGIGGSGGRDDKLELNFKFEGSFRMSLDQFLTVGRELPGLVSAAAVRFSS